MKVCAFLWICFPSAMECCKYPLEGPLHHVVPRWLSWEERSFTHAFGKGPRVPLMVLRLSVTEVQGDFLSPSELSRCTWPISLSFPPPVASSDFLSSDITKGGDDPFGFSIRLPFTVNVAIPTHSRGPPGRFSRPRTRLGCPPLSSNFPQPSAVAFEPGATLIFTFCSLFSLVPFS